MVEFIVTADDGRNYVVEIDPITDKITAIAGPFDYKMRRTTETRILSPDADMFISIRDNEIVILYAES